MPQTNWEYIEVVVEGDKVISENGQPFHAESNFKWLDYLHLMGRHQWEMLPKRDLGGRQVRGHLQATRADRGPQRPGYEEVICI